jgi:hypothetical protein
MTTQIATTATATATKLANYCILANYRIYDRTGGGGTEDIYAETLDAAIEAGREWIEAGDWSSEDGTYRTITLPCSVREIIRYRSEPLPGESIDDDGDLIDAEGYLIHTAADMGEIDEDATDDNDSYDCSGTYSDDLPECDASEDGEHDWQSPHSIVGGIRENPGVWSNGGTSFSTKSVCACCGRYNSETDKGSQCHPDEARSVIEIEDADEASLAWIMSQNNGYLPEALGEHLGREEDTLAHMQGKIGDLQVEAQDISIGIWAEIEETDLSDLTRDEAVEWLEDLTSRLEEAKAESED